MWILALALCLLLAAPAGAKERGGYVTVQWLSRPPGETSFEVRRYDDERRPVRIGRVRPEIRVIDQGSGERWVFPTRRSGRVFTADVAVPRPGEFDVLAIGYFKPDPRLVTVLEPRPLVVSWLSFLTTPFTAPSWLARSPGRRTGATLARAAAILAGVALAQRG